MKLTSFLFALTMSAAFAGEMVLINGGTFTMGDAKGKPDEKPHSVTVSSFYMDKYEITQAEYTKIMGQNPAKFQHDDHPVERIRWTDAALFCNLRSKAEGLTPCYTPRTWECDFTANGYRLPTEAEWEYACRAGSTGKLNFDGNEKQLAAHAWTRNNANDST